MLVGNKTKLKIVSLMNEWQEESEKSAYPPLVRKTITKKTRLTNDK